MNYTLVVKDSEQSVRYPVHDAEDFILRLIVDTAAEPESDPSTVLLGIS